jgi:hypothetical protein
MGWNIGVGPLGEGLLKFLGQRHGSDTSSTGEETTG